MFGQHRTRTVAVGANNAVNGGEYNRTGAGSGGGGEKERQ